MYDQELCKRAFGFMFVLLYRVCTHVEMGILAPILCVFGFVDVEGIYTCKTRNSVKEPFVLCLCYYRGYVNMEYWRYCQRSFVFMLVLL